MIQWVLLLFTMSVFIVCIDGKDVLYFLEFVKNDCIFLLRMTVFVHVVCVDGEETEFLYFCLDIYNLYPKPLLRVRGIINYYKKARNMLCYI
jgi:hypothetical protein